MPFQIRQANLDSGTFATKWAAGVGRSGKSWSDGYATPRVDPRAAAQAASATWLANTQAAAQRYHDNVGNYDADAAIAKAASVGATRYTQSAQSSIAKVQKMAPNLINAIKQGMASLPQDRSTFQARQARSIAMQNFMHGKKGQI
jgi:hypothetical protein